METIIGHLPTATTNPAPALRCYRPPVADALGIGLIIFPGGGYGCLAQHEGTGYAEHFAARGLTCFVVTYRLAPDGYRHPAMLEDGLAAVQTVRERAADFGIKAGALGVMGSSAGGHLAAHVMTCHAPYNAAGGLRPDFGVLCYPVISAQSSAQHKGSFSALLGAEATDDQREQLSCEKLVTADTPPCFLWHTREDAGVPYENSVLYSEALRRHGTPFELHVYDRGRHGLGLGAPFDWASDCLRWIRDTTEC